MTTHPMTRIRQRAQIQNSVMGSGQFGAGDRGSNQTVATMTTNPYDVTNYVQKWRQLVQMYETSWEARKIVRIPVEDALRKEWEVEDINTQFQKEIKTQLDRINFSTILKRSLMLERLFGGCLTFLGVEGKEDKVETPYHPQDGEALRFCNAIPISRIARTSWDHDPLSEHYMRPKEFLINGNNLHVSRCLVWDGEPLFDPYDYALMNFKANLAGFGQSKLISVWDDVIKAIGTRQAAYQLINMNNAILIATQGLADLQGTKSGVKALHKLKEIANQLTLYNAAIIDNKAEVKQHSASFGSVPELVLTFIQILSAASDIPATRFIGQAPGGLNATGESDLENYYNVIDAFQRQRIEPQLRRVYDVIGYSIDKDEWHKQRKTLKFVFPPLWNLTELEEAQLHGVEIDNALKLRDAGLCGDEKVIKEMNAKGCLSINLDETDIGVINDSQEEDIDPQEQIERLRQKKEGMSEFLKTAKKTPVVASPEPKPINPTPAVKKPLTEQFSKVENAINLPELIKAAGGDPEFFDFDQFTLGMQVEQEHNDVTKGDPVETAKIVLAHLVERMDYYIQLQRFANMVRKRGDKWVVLSHDGSKTLGTYGTEEEADKRLKEIEYFKHQNSNLLLDRKRTVKP